MSPHPFKSNPNSLGGRACLHCGKPPTHMNHSGMGEQEPTEQELEEAENIARRGEVDVPAAPLYSDIRSDGGMDPRREYEAAKRDESNFSITSANGYTTVQIKVAGPVTSKLLLAASAFMEEVQPKREIK